ncbi:MAG: hypothetical protein AAFN50_13470 [Pseudomonadota bacterium]
MSRHRESKNVVEQENPASHTPCDTGNHEQRLEQARERVARIDVRIDQILTSGDYYSYTGLESAQAQLLVLLRRAERQLQALQNCAPGNSADLDNALHATWDELGIAIHRLVNRACELAELAGVPFGEQK